MWNELAELVVSSINLLFDLPPNTACSGQKVCSPPEGILPLWLFPMLGVCPARSRLPLTPTVSRLRRQRKVMALARGNAGGDDQVRPGVNAGGGA